METHLKIKHLAPYFPHELEIIVSDEKGGCIVVALNTQSVYIDSGCDYPFEEIKPILRPFSDLTKEIEINGKKFIPINEIAFDTEIQSDKYLLLNVNAYVKINLLGTPFNIINKLFEWHFDVFDLLSNNLAIDINTL